MTPPPRPGGGDVARSISARLQTVAETVFGWSPWDELLALFNLAVAGDPADGDLLEIGAWCGRSTAALGLAAQVAGGRVVSFDLFPEKGDWARNSDGSYSLRVGLAGGEVLAYRAQTVWPEAFAAGIAPVYERYASVRQAWDETVRSLGLCDVATAYRSDSASLAEALAPGFRCRLAFIDADHAFEAVAADIARVTPLLAPGGWICLDDAFTSYEGVDRAIEGGILNSHLFDRAHQATRKMFVARKRPG